MIDTGEEFGLEPGQFGVADITIVFAHFILFGVGGLSDRNRAQGRHGLGRPRQNADRPRPLLGFRDIGRRISGRDHRDRLVGQRLEPIEHGVQPTGLHSRLIPISRHA
ncbi:MULTISPECIES: hypothetical protein [unclassified Brevundimonas]|uniref:hypothetical protein n=1 Tax=unclassified Brevundimonas TaxID=2622653 RepID=UPI0025BD6F7D|nr:MULTISPECIES: hypothetical protein [unclassified Brevundimonas]